jgi:DNA-binding response OmpR family regulator
MIEKEKILIVEDDENLGISLKKFFMNEGHIVTWVDTLEKARAENTKDYSLAVLDWMLPDGQGIDFLREIRKSNTITPVIMLTARTELIDKVLGLETGANDYLTKPFEPRELLARARVQLRQRGLIKTEMLNGSAAAKAAQSIEINLGDLRMALNEREVFYKGQLLEMTKMEYELLKLLAETPNRVFSREEILNKVWGYENYPTTRTVDTHILQLRQKTHDELIETVRGIGYRLKHN